MAHKMAATFSQKHILEKSILPVMILGCVAKPHSI